MSLDSPLFISTFLPLLILLLLLLRKKKTQNRILLISGLFFYAFSGIPGLCVLLAASCLAFLFGNLLRKKADKAILWIGIGLNLCCLGFYKYLTFLCGQILRLESSAFFFSVAAPIGISFFTFKIISYLTDVYRDSTKAAQSFGNLLLYVSFLPEILSGPISRYSDFSSQLTLPAPSAEDMAEGTRQFSIGFGKKMLLAYPLSRIADPLLSMEAISVYGAWIAAAGYMLQLYFDFSGYSDMAIGLARILGFHSPDNFRSPYLAGSITDFWRRWHITLSLWFRDYVYIPLGGNRKGIRRAAWNKFLVFLLCGIWHGAGWNYLLWGAWHGLFSALETLKIIPISRIRSSVLGRILSHLYTLTVVCIGFVVFREESLRQSGRLLTAMAGFGTGTAPHLPAADFLLLAAAAVFSLLPANSRFLKNRSTSPLLTAADYAVCTVILFFSILAMAAAGFQPFIYAQF